jgi:hypothetical protein
MHVVQEHILHRGGQHGCNLCHDSSDHLSKSNPKAPAVVAKVMTHAGHLASALDVEVKNVQRQCV